jgi:hypothetical protein
LDGVVFPTSFQICRCFPFIHQRVQTGVGQKFDTVITHYTLSPMNGLR